MTAASPSRSRVLTVAAAIACISLAGIGLSLSSPLIALTLAGRGVPATVIGLNTACASLGTLLVVPFIPPLAAAIGLRRLLLLTLAMGGAALALFPAFTALPAWFALRFVYGACLGTLFALSEFWITAASSPERRGLVMGFYATALSLGFAAGPALLALAGGAAPWLFWVGTAFFAVGSVPILFAGANAPPLEGHARANVGTYVVIAPIATVAAFVFGAVEQSAFAFLTLYGEGVGLSTAAAATLLALFGLGNLASQVPLGLLSDRMSRPTLLLICALVSAAGAAAMPLAAAAPLVLAAVVFVTGGLVGGLYTVGLAHLGARFAGAELATANAAFVMLYSLGMFLGAPAMGAMLDAVKPHGFALGLALLCGLYAALVAWRTATGRS